ncbi:MAG: hypothetical protein ACI8RZ_000643 [Myxococcota bacterium]|jgi:hypothetical protein
MPLLSSPLLSLLLACISRQEPPAEPPMIADDCAPSLIGRFMLTGFPGMNDVGPNGERPIGISKEYTFTETDYRMEGYPELTITGRYKVVSTDGLAIQVRLTDTIFDGTSKDDREIPVVFSNCGKTMLMEGMTYQRLTEAP